MDTDRLALLALPAVRSVVARELGREIEYHEVIGSTQDRARELASAGHGLIVVVADQQTAGHGRADRTWHSAPGAALLASWLFRPAPAEPALFALLAGVAVARALRSFAVADAGLKWPNDVWLSNGKVAGCLAHGTGTDCVIGIGINVAQRSFPAELDGAATSLARAGHEVDRLALLARLSVELDRVADPAARTDALAESRKRSILLGREIDVLPTGGAAYRARAVDLAEDGALVVESEQYGSQRIIAGEVRVRG